VTSRNLLEYANAAGRKSFVLMAFLMVYTQRKKSFIVLIAMIVSQKLKKIRKAKLYGFFFVLSEFISLYFGKCLAQAAFTASVLRSSSKSRVKDFYLPLISQHLKRIALSCFLYRSRSAQGSTLRAKRALALLALSFKNCKVFD
jgi:hypothetical protein